MDSFQCDEELDETVNQSFMEFKKTEEETTTKLQAQQSELLAA